MNALELADTMEKEMVDGFCLGYIGDAITMLRQQQTELDAFKLQYYNTGYSLQLRDKDETIRQQQAEIEALKAHLNAYQVAYNPAKHGVENEQ